MLHVDHGPAIHLGNRVVVRVGPKSRHGAQILKLVQFVAQPVGIERQARFRRFGIEEFVGLVGSFVNRATAVFGETHGFGFGDP